MGDSAAPNHGWGPLHVIQAIVRWGTPFNRIPSHMFRMFIFFETRDSEHKCWARESLINHKSKSQIIPQVFPLACNQLHGQENRIKKLKFFGKASNAGNFPANHVADNFCCQATLPNMESRRWWCHWPCLEHRPRSDHHKQATKRWWIGSMPGAKNDPKGRKLLPRRTNTSYTMIPRFHLISGYHSWDQLGT